MPLALASQRGARWWSANLHVLIDEERHARLTEESKRTGRSVGDIVRSAIDLHFDEERDQARRAAAARFLLNHPDRMDALSLEGARYARLQGDPEAFRLGLLELLGLAPGAAE